MKNMMTLFFFLSIVFSSLHAENSKDNLYQVVEECRKNTEGYPAIVYAAKYGYHEAAKFLIDRGEPVNAQSPDKSIWYEGGTYYDKVYLLDKKEPGYSALEIAVNHQDVLMVDILFNYNVNNRANPQFKKTRFINIMPYKDGYFENSVAWMPTKETSPLWQALSDKNIQIATLILQAYTDHNLLFAEFAQIRITKDYALMKVWAEKNAELCKRESVALDDNVIDQLLTTNMDTLLELNRPHEVEMFLQCGWIISQKHFESVVSSEATTIVELFLKHNTFEAGFDPYVSFAKQNRADLIENYLNYMQDLEPCLMAAIKCDATDVIKLFNAHHLNSENSLAQAVKSKQISAVELILETPISEKQLQEAMLLAYQVSAYDIWELLQSFQRDRS